MEVINQYSLLTIRSSKTLQCRYKGSCDARFSTRFKNSTACIKWLSQFINFIMCCIFVVNIHRLLYRISNINTLKNLTNQNYRHAARKIWCKTAYFDWNWLLIGNSINVDTLFYHWTLSCIQIQLVVISKQSIGNE